MITRLLDEETQSADDSTRRTFSVVFDPGEEVIGQLGDFARKEGIEDAAFEAIGGFQQTKLVYYNIETKNFDEIPLDEHQVEVLSLTGQITRNNGDPYVHVHTVLGRRDGTTLGGHLVQGVVRPVLIVTLTESAHRLKPHHA